MDSKEAKKRMMEGRIYPPGDEEIMAEQVVCMQKLWEYNQIQPKDMDKRFAKLQDMFAEIGEGSYIEPPLHANFGGKHVHFGKNVYANYNLTMVDNTHIYVGDNTMIGPNVTIATAGHPIDPALRDVQAQFNMEVHIGRNVWIGGGCVLLPGVSIGDNTVIGAGSIVTKDIPANVVAYGNPCRVIREIGEHDRKYYYRDRKVDVEVKDGQIESLTSEE